MHHAYNNGTINHIYAKHKSIPKEAIFVSTGMIITLVVLAVIIGLFAALYFFGRNAQKKQEVSQQQMEAMAQSVTMLIIDKQRVKMKDANLPAVVLENTPAYLRRSKVPVVKAKIGPKIMTLICDAKIYDSVPVKKEVKAVVSGIYITSIKGARGPLEVQAKPEKKKLFARKK